MKKIISLFVLTLLLSCQNNSGKNGLKSADSQKDTLTQTFTIPKEFLPECLKFDIHPENDTSVQIGNKGTVLHIPRNAFLDKSGNTIAETIVLTFKEYCNSAEMAFSKIPMIYHQNGQPCFFNSSGMFEIEGQLNGEKITIAKGKVLTIDYYLAKKNPEINFYRLKDDSSNWVLISKIKPLKAVKPEIKSEKVAKNTVSEILVTDAKNIVINLNDTLIKDRRIGSLLAAGSTDPGHSYPDIVKGLNIGSFGVYNCDQVYRLQNLITINAKYKDKNGIDIKAPMVLSMIDLKYNGAFSFNPDQFICDAKGKNVLLLFTRSKELYMLGNDEFAKMKITKSGEYTFVLENVTERIRNSKELAAYLKL